MSNEVVCVYQDCPLCGARGKKVIDVIANEKLILRKVSFACDEGRELIHEALSEHNIGTMPFYVKDGRFSTDIKDVLAEPVKKKPAKKTRKTKKIKEDNGADN